MTEPRNRSSNSYQGGGHFEFSSEKHWGTEQNDCRIFDPIDVTHLSDSISSIPFNLRHNIPAELFTVEQLEEFEVEASLALSRHTFQCKSKSKNITVISTPTECSQTPETDKLMKLILNNFSTSDQKNILVDNDSEQLDAILGNMKPLINILQDETKSIDIKETSETDTTKYNDQITSIPIVSEVEVTNDSGHWLDSMLDSDE